MNRRKQKEIEKEFIESGKLTREDINRLHKEESLVVQELKRSERDAKEFLKRKMGRVRFFLWNFFTFANVLYLPILGQENSRLITKAKSLGWEDTFQYPEVE